MWGFNWGGLANFFGSIIGPILQLLQTIFIFLWNTIVALYQFLFGLLVIVANFLLGIFGHVMRFFRNFRLNWIPKGILKLFELYDKLMRKLERILKPYLDFIRKVRDLWDKIFFRVFGPILNLIQQVRGVLGIFRIFGLKFAKRLDERLLRLEGKILEPYLEIRAKINEVISAINLVLDVGGLLRRSVTLGSLATVWGGLVGLLDRRMNRKLTPDEEASQKRDRERGRMANIVADANRRNANGFSEEEKEMMAAIHREMEAIAGTTIPHPVV